MGVDTMHMVCAYFFCFDINAHVYTHVQNDGLLVDAKGALFSTVEMSTGLCLVERLVDCSASLLTCTMIEGDHKSCKSVPVNYLIAKYPLAIDCVIMVVSHTAPTH